LKKYIDSEVQVRLADFSKKCKSENDFDLYSRINCILGLVAFIENAKYSLASNDPLSVSIDKMFKEELNYLNSRLAGSIF